MELAVQDQIVNSYLSGLSSIKLATQFDCDVSTVLKYLRKNNVTIKPGGTYRKYNLDESVFQDVNSEKAAYWLGFLMGDGYIRKVRSSGQHILGLTLCSIDLNHINKFRNFLGTDVPVIMQKARLNKAVDPSKYDYTYTKESSGIVVTSKKLVSDLEKVGIVEHKSLTAKVSEGLAYNKHFWRGELDADGSIGSFKNSGNAFYPRIRLVGSPILMTQYADFVISVLPECKVRVAPVRETKISVVQVAGKNALRLMDHLYSDSIVYLERKHCTVLDLMKKNNFKGVL